MDKQKTAFSSVMEFVIILIQAALFALLIRTFLFQPFVIPSGSMRPTLLVGDYIFTSKFSYGYSRYSFPYGLELFSGRILGREPKRGDIIVFQHEDSYTGESKDYIKRLIGLPGDRIQMKSGTLYINGKAVKREKVGLLNNPDITGVYGDVEVYRETLPNNVSYETLSLDKNGLGNNTQEFLVPEGHYFMMGDNRDDSEDSRFSLGYVSAEKLIGKAQIIFFSISNNSKIYQIWRLPHDVRWSRIFSFITKEHPVRGVVPERNAALSNDFVDNPI